MLVIDAISHVTVTESIGLRATLHAIDDDRFQCEKCKPATRPSKFCLTSSQNVAHVLEPDLRFRKCPGNFFSFSSLNILEMHNSFEGGVMPYPGAFADQPNKVIEAFRIISVHKANMREAARQRAEMLSRQRSMNG